MKFAKEHGLPEPDVTYDPEIQIKCVEQEPKPGDRD